MSESSIRAVQLADLIRDHGAAWIQRDFVGVIVSITQVTLSTDLAKATAWVTVFPMEKETEVIRKLKKFTPEYQHRLRGVLQRHRIPQLRFMLDTSERDSEAIDELLK